MVEKVKNLNWPLYSEISLILANLAALCSLVVLTAHTKNMDTAHIISYFSLMGLMVLVLLKLNHVAGKN